MLQCAQRVVAHPNSVAWALFLVGGQRFVLHLQHPAGLTDASNLFQGSLTEANPQKLCHLLLYRERPRRGLGSSRLLRLHLSIVHDNSGPRYECILNVGNVGGGLQLDRTVGSVWGSQQRCQCSNRARSALSIQTFIPSGFPWHRRSECSRLELGVGMPSDDHMQQTTNTAPQWSAFACMGFVPNWN